MLMYKWKAKNHLPCLISFGTQHSVIALTFVRELMSTFLLRELSRVLNVRFVELVCMIPCPSLLVYKMTSFIQEEARESMFYVSNRAWT